MTLALVTGGTSGIGYAFAQAYAQRGFDVVLVARDIERGTKICEDFRGRLGVKAEFLQADLAIAEDVSKVASFLEENPVDVLVNSAGFGMHGGMAKVENEGPYQQAIDVMIVAVMKLSAAATRQMVARGTGKIINIASASAWIMQGNYSAIKAWVLRYTQALSIELDGTGVTATAVCPGWVRTEFHSRAGISTKLPNFVWIPMDVLVRQALRDSAKGKMVSVPGNLWRFALTVAKFLPRSAIRALSKKLVSSRKKDA